MRHVDGIKVSLREADGGIIKEYDNGIDNEPHPDFDGSIATRRIAARGDTCIELEIAFDDSFKLYTADGVWIEIYTGSPVSPMSSDEGGQCWWIHRRGSNFSGTYTFFYYIVFSKRKSEDVIPFVTPPPDPGSYANASYRWVLGESQSLSISSLVVYIVRGKWDPLDTSERTMTEPRRMAHWRFPLDPEIIHSQWVRPLDSENGVPYIFEFRNMGPDGVDVNRHEANEEFGYGHQTLEIVEGDESSESDVSEEGTEESGAQETYSSDEDTHLTADEFEESETEDSIDTESDEDAARLSRRNRRNKRKRSVSRESQPITHKMLRKKLQHERHPLRISNSLHRGGRTACGPGEQDDDEELPRPGRYAIRLESSVKIRIPKLPRTTLACSEAASIHGSPGNTISSPTKPDDMPTKRTLASNDNVTPGSATIILPLIPPSDGPQNGSQDHLALVDLTNTRE